MSQPIEPTSSSSLVEAVSAGNALHSDAGICAVPVPQPGAHRAMWLEMAVVVSVAVLPDLYNSMASVLVTPVGQVREPPSFALSASWIIVRSVPAIAVTLFVIARGSVARGSGQWEDFGIKPVRPVLDLSVASGAVLLATALYYGAWLGAWKFLGAGVTAGVSESAYRFVGPRGAGWALLVLMALVNGTAEELVMRAYLLPQLERALRSTVAALMVTAAVFAAYHGYQGAIGILGAFTTGIAFGLVFIVSRRFWPLALAHAMMDIIGYARAA